VERLAAFLNTYSQIRRGNPPEIIGSSIDFSDDFMPSRSSSKLDLRHWSMNSPSDLPPSIRVINPIKSPPHSQIDFLGCSHRSRPVQRQFTFTTFVGALTVDV
jgi:hypothetical protein